MAKLVVYCDGSETQVTSGMPQFSKVKAKNRRRVDYAGYGLVLHHNGDTDELFGGYAIERRGNERGFYELMAFYKAVQYAEAHGYTPEDVAFYTDCSFCAYAGYHLHAGNYSASRNKTLVRLRTFRNRFFPGDHTVVMRLARWFLNTRVHWVKGHAKTVDNLRADLLARSAVKQLQGHKGYKNEWSVVSRLEWLFTPRSEHKQGEYVGETYFPFCSPQMA